MCVCFVDLVKFFYRVTFKALEWEMKKKGISYIVVRSVMSLCEQAKTRVKVDSEFSQEFKV